MRKNNAKYKGLTKKFSTINLRWWEIKFQDFTQANFFLLLARITKELFRCYKHLKTQFVAYLLALLAGWPYFHLVVGLSLIVGIVESMDKKVAIGIFGYSL